MAYRALRWNGLSLRNKLTIVNVALLTLGIVVAGIGTTLLLRPTLVGQLDAQLRAVAADPVSVVGGDPTTGRFTYDSIRTTPQPYYVAIVADDGTVLVDNWAPRPRAIAPDLGGVHAPAPGPDRPPVGAPSYPVADLHDGLGTSWRAVAVADGDYHADQVHGTLIVALALSNVNATMASFLAIFFGFGVTVVIFGAALTRVLVSATLQPLRSVEATAMAFASGDYATRLPPGAPNTEVGRLSRALNSMLGRIDHALDERQRTIAQMRRFVGDASHELRTPLVTVRGYAELYRMGALDEPEKVSLAMDSIEKEALRMGGLVEDLLQLARLDETRELTKDVIDLEPIAEDAAMDARASRPHRRVRALPVRVIHDEGERDDVPRSEAAAVRSAPAGDGGEPGSRAAEAAPSSAAAEAPSPSTPSAYARNGAPPSAARAQMTGRGAASASAADAVRGPADAGADSATSGGAGRTGRRLGLGSLLGGRPRSPLTGAAPIGQTGQGAEAPVQPREERPSILRRMVRRGVAPAADEPAAAPSPFDDALEEHETADVPAMVLANEDKVRQAISNIVGNAFRYTPDDTPLEIGVTVDVPAREAIVSVVDHGEGIPEQVRQKIFQRFWRADTSRARETGGSGLGLAIVSAIMKAHGGRVDVIETPGGGATFRLIFPLLLADPVDDEPSTGADRSSTS